MSGQKEQFKIAKSFEFEANVHYVTLQSRPLIGITNENEKLLKFYKVDELSTAGADQVSVDIGSLQPQFIYKNQKKITTVRQVSFGTTHGILIADKVGDLLFLNENNLERLATDPETVPGPGQEGADTFDYVAQVIYCH